GLLSVYLNPVLENLDGLSSLGSIDGPLVIHQNQRLESIYGLRNIDPATISGDGLAIMFNPALPVCNLPNFCTYLSDPDNLRSIDGNADLFLNEPAVSGSCGPCAPPA